MAKIYTTLFAAGALLFSGIGFAYAASAVDAPAVQAEGEGDTELSPLQPYGPDINLKFVVVDDEGVVKGTIIAPETLHGDYMTSRDDEPITGTMDIKLVRSCYDLGVEDALVKEWEGIEPKTELSFEDKDMTIGYGWNYRAIAIVNGAESPAWEGTLGVYAGIRPENVSDLTINANEGKAPVYGNLMVPHKVKDAEDFPGISYEPARVYIERNFRPKGTYENIEQGIIWEVENPETDVTLEFIDNIDGDETPEGTYYYNAYVEWKWGKSFVESKNIGLFPGVPNTPNDIFAEAVKGGAVIKWAPVTTANYEGGYIDPSDIKYSVYRLLGKNDNYEDITELVAENLTVTECEDNLEGIEKQMILKYLVYAENTQGKSNSGESNGIVVGPAVALPFIETFSTPAGYYSVGPDMLWSSIGIKGSYGDAVYWQIGDRAYIPPTYESILPSDSEEPHGLAYTNFNSSYPSGTVSYISGDIDFTGEESGKVTFTYYGHPDGAVKLYVDVMCDETVEEAEAGEGQPFVNVWNGTVYAEQAGWTEQEATFYGFANCNTINLRLRAISDQTEEDTVFIPACVEYIKVEAISEDPSKVEAINSDEVSVEYYDLQGIRLSAPVKGQPVIRRSVMNDGSVRASKVIAK